MDHSAPIGAGSWAEFSSAAEQRSSSHHELRNSVEKLNKWELSQVCQSLPRLWRESPTTAEPRGLRGSPQVVCGNVLNAATQWGKSRWNGDLNPSKCCLNFLPVAPETESPSSLCSRLACKREKRHPKCSICHSKGMGRHLKWLRAKFSPIKLQGEMSPLCPESCHL